MDDRVALPGAVLARYDLGEIRAVTPKSGGWMSACVDPLIDYRRESHLAQELYAWLMANAAFLQKVFC
jgi:hypothetical protein